MVTVPAFGWRYGPIVRGLILGLTIDGVLGAAQAVNLSISQPETRLAHGNRMTVDQDTANR